MPIIGFLWNYSPPALPFATGTSFAANRIAAMTARPSSSALQFGRLASPAAYDGDTQPMFGGDLYDRIHVSALSFALGNLVGEQTREITIWNAYRRARILEDIVLTDDDGIAVGGQPVPPLQFAPQQERTYEISISTSGPPVIDASIVYDFDEGQSLTIAITGTRIIAWTWPANWADGVLERLEWRTDLLQAYRGQEQARALRLLPRQIVEFSVMAEGRDRRHMEAALWDWGARVFAVPLWWDGLDLAATLPAGSLSVPVTAGTRNFRAGTLALLLGQDSRSAEVIEVESVGGGSITLARETAGSWPAGTRIYPARPARLDGNATLPRFTGAVAYGRLRFEMTEPSEYAADTGATTYRGYPVLTAQPAWNEDPEFQLERKLDVFDPGIGAMAVDDEAKMPITSQAMGWELTSRAEEDAHRRRLYALRGKQGRIWVPTWCADLVPVATLGDSALALDVEWCGYTLYHQGEPNRKDIRIELTNGSVYYRRVTASSELDANTERLSLDSALGVTVTPGQFAMVSFMALCRQASDAAEFAWYTGDAASTSTTFRAARHDV